MRSIWKLKFGIASGKSENFPKRGGFRTYKITVSTNREKRLMERLLILSSGRLVSFERLLYGKWLWDELTSVELDLFLALPSTLTNPLTIACLRARAQGVPKKLIRERLGKFPTELPFPSRLQYISLSRMFVTVERQELSLPKVRKYSGYSRHHNDKGSINPYSLEDNFNPPEAIIPSDFSREDLIFDFLVTGELSFFVGDSTYLP